MHILYVYMYSCRVLQSYTNIYTHTCTHTRTHTYTHTHTHTHRHTHTNTHTYAHTHEYTHIYTYIYTRARTHTHIHVHKHSRKITPAECMLGLAFGQLTRPMCVYDIHIRRISKSCHKNMCFEMHSGSSFLSTDMACVCV